MRHLTWYLPKTGYTIHNYCGKVELTCYEQVDEVEGHGEEDKGTIQYRWQHPFFPLYLEI